MPMLLHLRVFISSPGDVADERSLARRLLKDELPFDPFLRNKVRLDPVSWDDPAAPTPMVATLTPQEAVNRFGCRPSECDIVVVVLWSRLGTHLDLSKFQKPNGEPYLSGTEYEYEDAANADASPEILVYRRIDKVLIDADDPQNDARIAQRRKAKAFFDRFKNRDGSYRGSFTDYTTPTDFAIRLEKDLKTILQQRLEAAQRAPATAVDVGPPQAFSPVWEGSPYPGLRPFDFTEAGIFFGRGRETDALIARLRDPDQRFLAITGASGSGKSSLVRAGLLPRLLEGAIEGSQHWLAITFTPGSSGKDPFLALAVELARALPLSARKPAIEIAEALTHTPLRITDYAATVLAGRPADAALVLVVDQLEELFTLASTSHGTAYLDLLACAAGDPRLRVLATLRADFLSRAVAEPALRPLLQASAGTYPLAPPDPLALAEMIRRPAERAGLEIEDDVVREVLKDAGTDPGALPLVAFCLGELYRSSAPAHRLAATSYDDLGRLHGAISRRAEALLSDLRNTEGVTLDAALPTLFHALVHVDAAGTVTRRRTFRDELATDPPLPRLIEALIQGRLLRAEDAGGRSTITVAHEALLTAWPALREWVENHRGELQRLQRLLLSLESRELIDRQYAAEALGLGGIGPTVPADAVRALISLKLGDESEVVRKEAAASLSKIGPAAVPGLITVLGYSDGDVRIEAVNALGEIGAAAGEAVPALLSMLDDADQENVLKVVRTLGQIGPAAEEAVPALNIKLENINEVIRKEAALALSKVGPAAVPGFISVLRKSAKGCAEAANALGEIGAAAATAVPALATLLAHHEVANRIEAAKALGNIGTLSKEAVPQLINLLLDLESEVRLAAAEALGQIGPAAAEAVPALSAKLGNPDKRMHETARRALVQIGPAARAVVLPVLIREIESLQGHFRLQRQLKLEEARKKYIKENEEAIGLLGGYGRAAAEAVPALITLLADAGQEQDRYRAQGSWGDQSSAGRIGPPPAAAEAARVADSVCCALGKIGQPAVQVLIQILRDPVDDRRAATARALGKIGPAAAEAVPALTAALADADATVREIAAAALVKIGPV